jgi:hypothetical protein
MRFGRQCAGCATSGLVRGNKKAYSITSSAMESSVGGTSTPIARAVARLMMNSASNVPIKDAPARRPVERFGGVTRIPWSAGCIINMLVSGLSVHTGRLVDSPVSDNTGFRK